MDILDRFNRSELRPKYAKLAKEAIDTNNAFVKAKKASDPTIQAAIDDLYATASQKHAALQGLAKDASSELRDTTTTAAEEAKDKLTAFLRGEAEHEITHNGEKLTVKLNDTVGKEVRDSFIKTQEASAKVTNRANGFAGMVLTQKDGVSKAFKANTENMKFWKEGLTGMERAKGFAHGSLVVGSAIAIGDAAFRSKTSNGEDRSGTTRVLEAIVAGGVGTAALLGGSAARAL